jgi:drug/metabolite transporter (DMT)-like permease
MNAEASLPKAAWWMAGWLSMMMVLAVAGRQALAELPVFQVLELRSVLGLLMLLPMLHASGGWATVRTQRLGTHVARNAVHYAAQYGWFLALTLIPLAQVVAIEFTMPIWSAALAVLFLGERMNRWKTAAVVLGLVGVALIVRPNLAALGAATTAAPQAGALMGFSPGVLPGFAAALNPGQLVALVAALGFAVSVTLVKSMTRSEQPVTIIFWMLVVQSLIGLLPAWGVWRWPSGPVWGWVGVVAFCGTFSHYCMVRALQHAEATVVVPMDFLRVPLSALLGWWLYAEGVDLITVLGVVLILSGNLLNLRRTGAGPPAAVAKPVQAASAGD